MKNTNIKDLCFYTICISMIVGFSLISYPYSDIETKSKIEKLQLRCDSLEKEIFILRKLL